MKPWNSLYLMHGESYTDSDLTLDTGTTVICPLKSVRDLGVRLDTELTMKTHVSKVVSCCCYHQLHRIRQVRRLVGQGVAQQLVSAFILSRLDYCNSLLSCLPRSTIQSLQRVMNAAAQVKSSWTCRCATMWNQLWSSYICCRLSKELYIEAVSVHASHPHWTQYLPDSVADTGWGRLAQRMITFCQEQELDLENEVFVCPFSVSVRILFSCSYGPCWLH